MMFSRLKKRCHSRTASFLAPVVHFEVAGDRSLGF
jgi:hypothetical protein